MSKKNILMVGSDTCIKGGMTTVVKSFLTSEIDSVNIEYMATHYSGGTVKNIIKFFSRILILNKKIKKSDIIHMHMSERGSCIRKYLVFSIAKMHNKKIITHMHGAEFKEYFEKINNISQKKIIKLLKESDCVLTLGDNWDKYVRSIDSSINSIILNNSVNIPDKKVELESEVFNILFLAVIEKRKGIYELIEAAKLLLNEYDGSKRLKFIIAGTGKEEDEIKKIVDKYNINQYFDFLGWVDDKLKEEVIKKSHLFLLPSYNEGLPVSILEAMSYGLPIISTDVGSINEAVKNNINGFLINPGDINELKDKILTLINDDNRWNSMSIESKYICYDKFNQSEYLKKIEKIYYDL